MRLMFHAQMILSWSQGDCSGQQLLSLVLASGRGVPGAVRQLYGAVGSSIPYLRSPTPTPW